MNYLLQLNAIWEKQEIYNLSGKQIAVYFALLDCANKLGWKDKICIPNTTLMAKTKCNKQELLRIRKNLISKELISYDCGHKNQAGEYTIVPLYDTAADTYVNPNKYPPATPSGPIYKSKLNINKNKTKLNVLSPVVTLQDKDNNIQELFACVWSLYPKKVKKKDAYTAFEKLQPTQELTDEICKAIKKQAQSYDWTKDNGRFIPLLTTYIHGERWKDENEIKLPDITPDDPRYI